MLLALPAALRSQARGVHPHVAPINTAAQGAYSQPRPGTPQFNVPELTDLTWNNGEGFQAGSAPDADYGGYLGNADPNVVPGVELGDIFHVSQTLGGSFGWLPYQWTDPATGNVYPMQRFVGYLRPGQLGPYGAGRVTEAAFEIFAPVGDPPSNHLVIALGVWATTGWPRPADGGRFAYPGTQLDGLVPDPDSSDPLRHGHVPDATALAPAGHTVISGYIVTRIFGRPEVFALQRTRELRQAIDLMLGTAPGHALHPPGIRQVPTADPGPACMVMGGSFGGLTSQVLCLRWPNEFHGGFAHLFGASPRRVLADQFNLAYLVQRCGFAPWGGAYWGEDTLNWGTAFRDLDKLSSSPGWDYFNTSSLVRYRRGQLRRPFLWSLPDEDTIGHGTDWLPLLTGTRNYTARSMTWGPALLAFHAVDLRDHGAGWHTTAIGNTSGVYHPRVGAFELIPHVWSSWNTNPVVAVPPTLVDDGSDDPYAWVQDRILMASDTTVGGPLQLDPAFGIAGKSAGQGLCLGFDESLRVAELPGVEGASIFVGSADGIVTRFEFAPQTGGLAVAAQSVPLGYGAYALAVGELDGGEGHTLVVGTKNHLFKLDAMTLVLQSGGLALGYEHTFPRRIQIADVFGGPDYPGNEVVFTTLMGHLVVLSGGGFSTWTDLGEPGIQDFVVLEGVSNPYATMTDSDTPIVLQSHRGHLAHITCNKVPDPLSRNPSPAMLHAWTDGEHGAPADLELIDAPSGQGKVVVGIYHVNVEGSVEFPIRVFDAMTLLPATVAQHGIATGLGWHQLRTHSATHGLDIAPIHMTGGALAGFVVLLRDRIAWVPLPGQSLKPEGYKLDGFPPASGALALATADLTTRASGETYREEIILSTLRGHVVWFHLEDMLANGTGDHLTLPNVPAPPSTAALPYTNETLAGTWGMLAEDLGQGQRIFAAGQAGSMYEVDPLTGAATRHAELRQTSTPILAVGSPDIVTSPVRDLEYLGSALQNVPSGVEWRKLTGAGPNAWWLETTPWQNVVGDVLRPIFTKAEAPPFSMPPRLRIDQGFVPIISGGAAVASGLGYSGATAQLHCWGGDHQTYSDMIEGIAVSATQVIDSWYTSRGHPVTWAGPGTSVPPKPQPSQSHYGPTASEGKDLRNIVRPDLDQSYQHQSLRVIWDDFGPVVVAGTPGGSVVVLRPGSNSGASTTGFGTVLWDSSQAEPWPIDDGFGAIGLAVRKLAGSGGGVAAVDIFLGVPVAHLNPPVLTSTDPGTLSGGIHWLRWTSSSPTAGAMTEISPFLFLDPGGDPRGGFGVCGLAIGDVIVGNPGDELVATTLEGDLYVFDISSGALSMSSLLYRTWVRGALGACNGIVIIDADGDGKNELYVSGSQGIWKWRQP